MDNKNSQLLWLVVFLIVILLAGCSPSISEDSLVYPTPTIVIDAPTHPTSSDDSQVSAENSLYPTPAATLSELIIDLSSDDPLVRVVSIDALEEYGDDASVAVPLLRDNLYYDGFSDVRRSAAIALGRLGELAKDAVPDLISVVENDTAPGVVYAAIEAIGLIGDSSVVPRLAVAFYCDDISFYQQRHYYSIESCHPVAILSAEAISLLTGEHFTDAGTGRGYVLSEDGTPLILIDARKWWEEVGQYQEWSVP